MVKQTVMLWILQEQIDQTEKELKELGDSLKTQTRTMTQLKKHMNTNNIWAT